MLKYSRIMFFRSTLILVIVLAAFYWPTKSAYLVNFTSEKNFFVIYCIFKFNCFALGTSGRCPKACLPHGSWIYLQRNLLRKCHFFQRFIPSPSTGQQCSGEFLLPLDNLSQLIQSTNSNRSPNPFQLKVSFFRRAQNRYAVLFGMKNVTIDMCKYLKGGVASNFMNLIVTDLKETSNLVHPCPYQVRKMR